MRPRRILARAFARCLLLSLGMVYSLLYLGSRLARRGEAVVLAYHSVGFNRSFFTVSPTEFYRQMEHLRRNYNIVPIEDIVEFAAGKRRLPEKAVAITFDDGYGDNYSRVYPYLKSHGRPATIFISTGYVGRQLPLGGSYLNMLNWRDVAGVAC